MSTDPWAPLQDRLASAEDLSGVLRVTRGQQVLWESCHGLADRANGIPVHPGTRFATASLSKMFTAVAVVDTAARGEFGLDTPVTSLLPPHLRPSTLREDVTVHHLLSHTSGIADYFEEDEDLPGYNDDYGSLWRDLPVYQVRDYTAMLPLFADLPPICPPGEAYHYSNAGYVLLGILLAHVTEKPFAEAVAERVFTPAGMTGSGYPAADEVHPGVALNYLPPAAEGMPWRTNIFSVPAVGGGDGGAVVTAGDVEVFLRALQTGSVWGEELSRLVLTRHVITGGHGWASGYGVDIRPDGAYGQDGGDPGVFVICRYLPWSDTTAVLLANVDEDTTPDLEDLAEVLIDSAEAHP